MRVGAIDIGTNTVRLLVVDAAATGRTELARAVTVTRLGQDVDRTGMLHRDAIARTVEVLERYGAILDDLEVASRRVIATSATRDAANASELGDAVHRAVGVAPEVISGDEEARLSFRGATAGRMLTGPVLVVDAGGGSTEFVAGLDEPAYAASVDIGSVRLTERYLGRQPSARAQVAAAEVHVRDLLAAALELPPVDGVIGVAGTFTALAAMHLTLPAYDRSLVEGTRLTLSDLDGLVAALSSMALEEIEAVPSMDPARAPVMLGGAIVAAQAVAFTGHDAVTVSESDILDGVAMGLLGA